MQALKTIEDELREIPPFEADELRSLAKFCTGEARNVLLSLGLQRYRVRAEKKLKPRINPREGVGNSKQWEKKRKRNVLGEIDV